jgi:hypothetical protein
MNFEALVSDWTAATDRGSGSVALVPVGEPTPDVPA